VDNQLSCIFFQP